MIRGLIFDINGTLTEIWTNEEDEAVWRVLSNFLIYQGIDMPAAAVRDAYFAKNQAQRRDSGEEFPEFDAVRLFSDILDDNATGYTRRMPKKKRKQLPLTMAELFRAATLNRLELYDGVKKTLKKLKEKYRLAAVSDGQTAWAYPELHAVGLAGWFDPLIVSGDFGYRKPDERLFLKALKKMNLRADEVVFVGNDLYRDVYGAAEAGMKTVFFKSNQGDHDYPARADCTIGKFPDLTAAVRLLDER